MFPLWTRPCGNSVSEFPRTNLLSNHDEPMMEECLIQLDQTLQDMGLIGKMNAELAEPVADGLIGQLRETHGLADWDLGRPAPQDDPELHHRQFHVSEPGVGE